MIRALSASLLLLSSLLVFAAEDVEQLDADFLEYLAHLEGDDDDWTLVAQPEETQTPARKEADAKAPKSARPAEKPAVDER